MLEPDTVSGEGTYKERTFHHVWIVVDRNGKTSNNGEDFSERYSNPEEAWRAAGTSLSSDCTTIRNIGFIVHI